MTRAQRLELLKQIEKDIHVCSLESTFLDDAKSCAIHEVIEELEQEPFINKPCVSEKVCEHDKNKALDKIRAEIEQDAFKDVSGSKFIFVNRVNQIIDKYKAESGR